MTAVSKDGFYLTAEAVRKIPQDETFKATLKADFGNQRGRLFHRCTVGGDRYIADAITGSLYYPNGSSAAGGKMSIIMPKTHREEIGEMILHGMRQTRPENSNPMPGDFANV